MEYSTLLEVVAAMHLSKYVQSPFANRGGLMLVAPPGAFKTTITEIMDEFPTTQVISDLNVQSLNGMKDQFLSNNITTLAFSDFGKLYKRHQSVASNVEGIIMALADEGFRKPSWANQSAIGSMPARVCIIAGMTSKFYEQMSKQWEDNGFLRRFLFAFYQLGDTTVLEDAAQNWKKAQLDGDFQAKIPTSRNIAYDLTEKEVSQIAYFVRHQHNRISAGIILTKIYCVLKWKFQKEEGKAMRILKDFSPCLAKDGAILILKEKEGKK